MLGNIAEVDFVQLLYWVIGSELSYFYNYSSWSLGQAASKSADKPSALISLLTE